MSFFNRRSKALVFGLVIVLSIVAGYAIEYFEGETFVEEIVTSKEGDAYFAVGEHIIDGKININAAELEDLMELDGIGEKLAGRIIEYRTGNGPFLQTEGLMRVPGIGEKLYENIKDKICAQ